MKNTSYATYYVISTSPSPLRSNVSIHRQPHAGLYNCISRLRFALPIVRGLNSGSLWGFTSYSCPHRTQSVQVFLQGSDGGECFFATKARTVIYYIIKFLLRVHYVIQQWPIGRNKITKELATKLTASLIKLRFQQMKQKA
jgi:hypothetical protein